MNVNEVPQDSRDHLKHDGKIRKVVYAVDKDGKYTGVNSEGWEAENEALKQAWDDIDETLAEIERKVRAGELSPIPYYMQKNLMDLSLLATYAGKWKWQVKRHFRPDIFGKLDKAMKDKYASIFNITTAELVNFGKSHS